MPTGCTSSTDSESSEYYGKKVSILSKYDYAVIAVKRGIQVHLENRNKLYTVMNTFWGQGCGLSHFGEGGGTPTLR